MSQKQQDSNALAIAGIRRWIGNPLARRFIRFLITEDTCGNRLDTAIDLYIGIGHPEACIKCRFAGLLLQMIMQQSARIFGVDESQVRGGLQEPVFRKGLKNVLKGISDYGVTMPQKLDAPFLVVWDVTQQCNLRCRHCYRDAGTALPGEMNTDDSCALIDQLSDAGIAALAFSGGEPLMRKDLVTLIARAKSHGLYVSVASNGTLVTPEMAGRLRTAGMDYIEISVDGCDAATHDNFRGMPGVFSRTMEGIKNCVDAGIYTCIATTLTRETWHQVDAIHALGHDLGVQRMMIFNFIPTGRGADKEAQAKDLRPEEREALLKRIMALNETGEPPLILSTAPQFARVALQWENGNGKGVPVGHFYAGDELAGPARTLAEFIGGCGAGRLYCSIEPEGDVQPCVFMPLVVGNVRERPFCEIWHTAPVLLQLRDRRELKGTCGTCRYRLVCGGCRARAWAYYGDLNAPDPGCILNQQSWNALQPP